MTDTTKTEALRLADAIDPFTRPQAPDHLTVKVAADELRRLSAVEAERDRFSQESARHFIRAREWAERAGAMEAERDRLAAECEALRADAAMLDWLEDQFRTSTVYMSGNHPYRPNWRVNQLAGPTFRDAITAAMGGKE